jgi:hypothetical protein
MMLGFWKLKVTAGIGAYGMLNQSNQSTKFGQFSYLDPPHDKRGFQLTEICMT